MKLYIYILVPLVLLGALVVGGIFILPAMDSPEGKLHAQIDEPIELAQRMLYAYDATAPHLDQAFAAATTQPDSIDGDKWRTHLDVEGERNPFAANPALKDRLSSQGQLLRQLSQEIAGMTGEEPVAPPLPGPGEAQRKLLEYLKDNHALLDAALAKVRQAINTTVGEGESEARGSSNPTATRLEAILLHHKADLMRREAALARAAADVQRKRAGRVLAVCRDLDQEIQGHKSLLAGGTAPGMAARTVTRPSALPSAATKPAPRTGGWWIFDKLAKQVSPREAVPAPAPDTGPQEEPGLTPPPSEPEVAEAPPPPGPAEVVPPLAARLAALQKQRAETVVNADAAQAEVDRFTKDIGALTARLEEAKSRARDAELKMIAAQQKGLDTADPKAVQPFVDEYRRLSQANREALREAETLERGSIRNARPANDDPDHIATSPLVPAEPGKPMQPERGLTALKTDLATAQAAVQANKTLLREIDRQIAELTARREIGEDRLEQLDGQRRQLMAEVSRLSGAAVVAVIRADQLEKEAIDLASGNGLQAAQRAQTAASEYQRAMQAFVRSENPVDTPDRKLSDMASDQFTSANAVLTQADLHYLIARTYVQQAADLRPHQQLLTDTASLGMAVQADPQTLPEGLSADAAPACATSPDAAAKTIEENETKAAEAAKQALDLYTQAAGQLKDLWVVHANIAAIHTMLAQLPPLPGDTEDHLALARQTYTRAIQGREKRPDYPTYHRIAEGLKKETAPPAGN
ncbi:MAG: hypothetical protein HY718_16785 [Planctomycetes bacterium]|nr:hypothetical protein [Planctomycetota bacterium]